MSAELPSLTRRELIITGRNIWAAWLLSPLVSACDQFFSDNQRYVQQILDSERQKIAAIPRRLASWEWVPWQTEKAGAGVGPKEIAPQTYLFGHVAKLGSDGQGSVHELSTDRLREFQLPLRPRLYGSMTLSFSPDQEVLVIWCPTQADPRFPPLVEHVFLMDLESDKLSPVEIDTRETPLPLGKIEWSGDGRFFLVSSSGQVDPGFAGSTRVFDRTGRILYSRDESFGHGFSPNGEWLLLALERLRYEAVHLPSKKTLPLFPVEYSFSWSPDSKRIVALVCQQTYRLYESPEIIKFFTQRGIPEARLKTDPMFQNFVCDNPTMTIIGVPDLQEQNSGLTGTNAKFSPDGRSVIFVHEESELFRMELLNGRQNALYKFSQGSWVTKIEFMGAETFRALVHPPSSTGNIDSRIVDVYTIDSVSGVGKKNARIATDQEVTISNIASPNWALSYANLMKRHFISMPARTWFLLSLADGKTHPVDVTDSDQSHSVNVGVVENGSRITTGQEQYIVHGGRRYMLGKDAQNVASFIPQQRFPRRFLKQLPESENRLGFSMGDVLLAGSKAWYLKAGYRWAVDLDRFVPFARFNKKVWEVEPWIVDQIPIGQEPWPSGQRRFTDWDGREIATQQEGGIIVAFINGWQSHYGEASENFFEVRQTLGQLGITPEMMIELSYRAGRDRNGMVTPQPYDATDTGVSPEVFLPQFSWQMERYKQLLPRSQVLLIGFSLGGLVALGLTRLHPDFVFALITLDSPLKGLDKGIIPGEFEGEFVKLIGEPLTTYLIERGDDPETDKEVEEQVRLLVNRGVEVYTFASTDDHIIHHEQAYSRNTLTKVGDHHLNLRFPMTGLFSPQPTFESATFEALFYHWSVRRHPLVREDIGWIAGREPQY